MDHEIHGYPPRSDGSKGIRTGPASDDRGRVIRTFDADPYLQVRAGRERDHVQPSWRHQGRRGDEADRARHESHRPKTHAGTPGEAEARSRTRPLKYTREGVSQMPIAEVIELPRGSN